MTTSAPQTDPGDREALESEREFLLKSIDDLERERAEGGIDDDTYETLRSDYTARAAEVLRALKSGRADRVKRPPVPKGRRWLFVAAAIGFAGSAAFALAHSEGQRDPGQTITGNTPSAPASAKIPDTYAGHYQAGVRFEREGNFTEAAKELLAASKKAPKRAEPFAELGWLLTQAVGSGGDVALIPTAEGYLDRAIRLDPGYVQAYLYKGAYLLTLRNDPKGALPLLQRYLRDAPQNAPLRNMATALVQRIEHPNATTTTTNG